MAATTLMKPPSEHILRVEGLEVRRGRTRILRRVSWAVAPGEHWVILGANGSGKTSLLKALTGYLMPTGGTIQVLGETYGDYDWRDLRKHVGLVSSALAQSIPDDEPGLDTVTSGCNAIIGQWRPASAPQRTAARRLLRQLGCVPLAERPWGVLSQGERQRILIARALIARPAVLFLDEPCAGLDPAAREHFLHFLHRLGRRASCPSMVLVTHHVEEIMPVFSRVLVLKRGAVLTLGPKRQILSTRNMLKAFGPGVSVVPPTAGRYQLRVARRTAGMV